MKIRLQVIRPIHITDGVTGTYSKVDYIFSPSENLLYILDFDKLLGKMKKQTYEMFRESFALGDVEKIRTIIQQVSPDLRVVSNYVVSVDSATVDTLKTKMPEILPYIKTQTDKGLGVYIPGTSLKGSLRTALIYTSFKNRINWQRIRELIRRRHLDRLLEAFGLKVIDREYYETYVLRGGKYKKKININTDPFSLIRIRDTDIKPLDVLMVAKIVIIDFITNKEIEQLAEIVKENTEFETELELSRRIILANRVRRNEQFIQFRYLFQINDFSNLETVENQVKEQIVRRINEFSRDVIEYDRRIVQEINENLGGHPLCRQYLDELNELEQTLRNCGENEFILPIGRFTGSISKSLLILYISYYLINYYKEQALGEYLARLLRRYYKNVKHIFPISRKLIDKIMLIGWLKGKIT